MEPHTESQQEPATEQHGPKNKQSWKQRVAAEAFLQKTSTELHGEPLSGQPEHFGCEGLGTEVQEANGR